MPILPPNPTLADFQRYVQDMEVERGFEQQMEALNHRREWTQNR